jgi:hypothetical protein
MHRRGYIKFEYNDDQLYDWPRCEINDCKNGICHGMSNSLCYPHGIEFGAFTKEQFEHSRANKNG